MLLISLSQEGGVTEPSSPQLERSSGNSYLWSSGDSKFRLPACSCRDFPERSQAESSANHRALPHTASCFSPAKEMTSTSNVQWEKSLAPAQRFMPLLAGGCFSFSRYPKNLASFGSHQNHCLCWNASPPVPLGAKSVRQVEETVNLEQCLRACPPLQMGGIWWKGAHWQVASMVC